MSEVDKKAAQIDADLKAADRKRADDAEAADGTNAKILGLLTSMSARLDKLEKPAADSREGDDGKDDLDSVDPDAIMSGHPAKSAADRARADENACSAAQISADSVAHAHGMKSPPPMAGERPEAYQRRLVRQWQHFSKTFKAVDLASVSGEALNGISRSIFADAIAASHRPDVPEGQLYERTTRDASGREIRTFYGSPKTWMSDFMSPAGRLTKINVKGHD